MSQRLQVKPRTDYVASLYVRCRSVGHSWFGGGPDWALPQGIQPVAWINLRSRDRMAWSDWRQAFIDRYHELAFALQLRGGHHTPGATPA